MRSPLPRLAAVTAVAVACVAVTAGAVTAGVLTAGRSGPDWSSPHPAPTATGTLGPGFLGAGFLGPGGRPSPEATVRPRAGSWDDVRPSPGMRVVLLTAGDDAPTRALVAAVRQWAHDEDVDLRTVTAQPHLLVDGIVEAMDLHPDLVVSAGSTLVDPLATVTANHLDQQFLVVGAELAEPTANVTAVDWSGASYRGEGLGASSTWDPASFTEQRCASAVRAGVAAVLHGLTGIVVWID